MMGEPIKRVLDKNVKEFLRKKGVVAVGQGYKVIKGQRTNMPCVVVSVERKRPLKEIKKEDLISSWVDALPTDVVETGIIRALHTQRHRPAMGGISVGEKSITCGTLGCLVKRGHEIFILSNNHILACCFDDKTEVLTKKGFKFWQDVDKEDEFATLNPESGNLEYQKATKIIVEQYAGKMLHFKSQCIDQLVTPNHRMWAQRTYKSGSKQGVEREYGFVLAEDIEKDMVTHKSVSYEFYSQAKWDCTSVESFILPEVEYSKGKNWNITVPMPIDKWLELFGWYIADGCAVKNSNNGQRFVSIRKMDGETREHISDLATACGFTPWNCKSGAVVINSKQLYEYLAPLGKAKEKHIPQEIKNLPPEQLKYFLEGYMQADGCYDKADQLMVLSATERLIDDLQEIFLKCGYSFSSKTIIQKTGYNPGGIYYTARTKKMPSLRLACIPKYVDYDGKIFCATVPNGLLFVRRNGKTMWSGNSNDAEIGDAVIQPGSYDDGKFPEDHIAELAEFVPINFMDLSDCPTGNLVKTIFNALARVVGSRTRFEMIRIQAGENLVDAAIAKPLNSVLVTPEIMEIGTIAGVRKAELGMAIKKSGRTTGLTTGEITQVDVTCRVQYGEMKFATFTDQVMAGKMCAGGDSGSSVLTEDNHLTGLLFAGSENSMIANRIENVFELLKVELYK